MASIVWLLAAIIQKIGAMSENGIEWLNSLTSEGPLVRSQLRPPGKTVHSRPPFPVNGSADGSWISPGRSRNGASHLSRAGTADRGSQPVRREAGDERRPRAFGQLLRLRPVHARHRHPGCQGTAHVSSAPASARCDSRDGASPPGKHRRRRDGRSGRRSSTAGRGRPPPPGTRTPPGSRTRPCRRHGAGTGTAGPVP